MTIRTKQLSLCVKSAGDPSAEQLAAIREYTLADLPAEKLYVRTFVVAHNAIDRDRECFDEGLLGDFARTLPGKGLFVRHPSGWDGDSGPGKGRWFAAKLERMPIEEARTLLRAPDLQWPPGVQTAVLLQADAYLIRTASNADMLEEIDGGVVGDVSVGFNAKDRERITDGEGRELNAYRLLGPGEALEASLVWLGAQPGARAIKGASRNPDEDDTVDKVDKNLYDAEVTARAAAEQKVNDLQRQLDEARPSHDVVLGLRSALGDDAHLVDHPQLLADAVKAANARRDELIDDIIAGERAAGICGDDGEAVNAAKAIYAGYPLDKLEARAKHWRDRTPAGGKVTPSNPDRQPPGDPTAGAKGVPGVFADATL